MTEKIKCKGWKFTNPKTKEVHYLPDWIADQFRKNRENEIKEIQKEYEKKVQELLDKIFWTPVLELEWKEKMQKYINEIFSK